MKKGQLTIEFLIILVAMLLLFSAISMDLIEFSLTNTLEIQTAEMVRSTKLILNSSVNSINLQGPGARRTLYIRAPSDCDFIVNPTFIELECEPESASYEDYNGMIIGETPEKINYVCKNCEDMKIKSGVLGEIQIVKFS